MRPDPGCPVEIALLAISGRWTTLILRELMGGPRSFGELRGRLPTLTAKVLTDRLRELEARHLVDRAEIPGFPPRTRYALTPAGAALRPLLIILYRTGVVLRRETALRRSDPDREDRPGGSRPGSLTA